MQARAALFVVKPGAVESVWKSSSIAQSFKFSHWKNLKDCAIEEAVEVCGET